MQQVLQVIQTVGGTLSAIVAIVTVGRGAVQYFGKMFRPPATQGAPVAVPVTKPASLPPDGQPVLPTPLPQPAAPRPVAQSHPGWGRVLASTAVMLCSSLVAVIVLGILWSLLISPAVSTTPIFAGIELQFILVVSVAVLVGGVLGGLVAADTNRALVATIPLIVALMVGIFLNLPHETIFNFTNDLYTLLVLVIGAWLGARLAKRRSQVNPTH